MGNKYIRKEPRRNCIGADDFCAFFIFNEKKTYQCDPLLSIHPALLQPPTASWVLPVSKRQQEHHAPPVVPGLLPPVTVVVPGCPVLPYRANISCYRWCTAVYREFYGCVIEDRRGRPTKAECREESSKSSSRGVIHSAVSLSTDICTVSL